MWDSIHKRGATQWRQRLAGVLAAALLAVVVAASGLVGTSAEAADESTQGVTLSISYGGETYDGATVVTPGTTYTARLQYLVPQLTAGSSVTVEVPEGVTVPAGALNVPAGNTIVESLSLDDDGNVVIGFREELDSSINQGVLAFDFVFDEPTSGTAERTITWSLNGEPTEVTIIVKDPDDQLRPHIADGLEKSVGTSNLNALVEIGADGRVSLKESATSTPVQYTVRLTASEARDSVVLGDAMSDYLSLDHASLEGTLTTWDEYGFNREVAPISLGEPSVVDGLATFPAINLPEQSILTVRYDAYLSEARLDELVAELQERADAVDGTTGGAFRVELPNTVSEGAHSDSASVSIGGRVSAPPAPNLGAAFGKQSSLSGVPLVSVDEEGSFVEPVTVEYTLRANLSQFAGFEDTSHALSRNVVVIDTLPSQAHWVVDSATVTSTGAAITEASSECLATGSFGADECVFQYQIIDEGQTLQVNFGRDVESDVRVVARAQWEITAGLPVTENPSGSPELSALYRLTNDAYFHYQDGPARRARVNDSVGLPHPPGTEIDDPRKFSKSSTDDVVLQAGETALVPYTVTLGESVVDDLRSTRIIDDVRADLFDISDLEAIRDSISGSYGWAQGLGARDFEVALSDGDLVFTITDSFGSDLEWMPHDMSLPLDRRLELTFSLPTHPVVGKQTITLTNAARVESNSTESYTWVSEATGSATSYGDELEVEKLLYEGDGNWTQNLRAELDSDGQLVHDSFVYRVNLVPHGSYAGVRILPLADYLPAGVEFEGFVADSDIDSQGVTSTTSMSMGGNVVATWDAASGAVRIEQQPGTVLPENASVAVNFKVTVTDFSEDVAIVNRIGSTTANIVPSHGFPLSIAKVDSERPDTAITDPNARFTLTGPTGEVVTDEAYVVDGQLVVRDGDGSPRAIVVPPDETQEDGIPAGEYVVTETVAPEGYALADRPVVAVIAEDGSSAPVTLYNEPLPLMAIGDLVWIDEDGDGQQGDGEAPLPGVTVDLYDATSGDLLASTVTNDAGRYLFDLLSEGEYRVRFTLTSEQQDAYAFTTPAVGGIGDDSDASRTTGETSVITLDSDTSPLVAGGDYVDGLPVKALLGVDPTWDAGVIVKPASVSIGDYVWLDRDRDGRQDDAEAGISAVVLTLVGPDGQPVVDVYGTPVEPVVTDSEGRYLFADLPLLDEGQSYTVTVDREASAKALAGLTPTAEGVGSPWGDSSTWIARSRSLTEGGQQDLTLDFGFVLVAPSEPSPDPTTPLPEPSPSTPGPDPSPTPMSSTSPAPGSQGDDGAAGETDGSGSLPVTGAQVGVLLAVSVVLSGAGIALLTLRRRRHS